MKKYIISVDGGGTKTKAIAYDKDASEIASFISGPGSAAVVSEDEVWNNVIESIDGLLHLIDNNNILVYIQVGLSAYSILEQIESDQIVYTFYKAMIDYLNDRELVLLIDDGCLDDGLAMAFYKDKEKLYFEMIYRDGKEPFEIEEKLFWYYPYNSKVTKEEQRKFNNAVEEYITFNKDLLKKVGK